MNNKQLKEKWEEYQDYMATYNALQYTISKTTNKDWNQEQYIERMRNMKAKINTEMQVLEGFFDKRFPNGNWENEIKRLKDF